MIQVIVDESGLNGQFILTGSHQLSLGQAISQSLAGRNALLTLLPFSISEVMLFRSDYDRDTLIYQGFMPRIYDQKQDSVKAYRNSTSNNRGISSCSIKLKIPPLHYGMTKRELQSFRSIAEKS